MYNHAKCKSYLENFIENKTTKYLDDFKRKEISYIRIY